MTPGVSITRNDGSLVDLTALRVDQVDFTEVAETLSKLARFDGRNRGMAYSVGQHSVLGAWALLDERADPAVAALFLLHDAHEYLIGDMSTPARRLFALHLQQLAPDIAAAGLFDRAVATAKSDLDRAIYGAAGLPQPSDWTPARRAAVKQMDARMLEAEKQALFGRTPDGRVKPPKFRGALKPGPPARAEAEFLKTYRRLIGEPVRRRAAQ